MFLELVPGSAGFPKANMPEKGKMSTRCVAGWDDLLRIADRLSDEDRRCAMLPTGSASNACGPVSSMHGVTNIRYGDHARHGGNGFSGRQHYRQWVRGLSHVSMACWPAKLSGWTADRSVSVRVHWSCIPSTALAVGRRKPLLPLLASGTMIGCFRLTEPDHGSDPAGAGPCPPGRWWLLI